MSAQFYFVASTQREVGILTGLGVEHVMTSYRTLGSKPLPFRRVVLDAGAYSDKEVAKAGEHPYLLHLGEAASPNIVHRIMLEDAPGDQAQAVRRYKSHLGASHDCALVVYSNAAPSKTVDALICQSSKIAKAVCFAGVTPRYLATHKLTLRDLDAKLAALFTAKTDDARAHLLGGPHLGLLARFSGFDVADVRSWSSLAKYGKIAVIAQDDGPRFEGRAPTDDDQATATKLDLDLSKYTDRCRWNVRVFKLAERVLRSGATVDPGLVSEIELGPRFWVDDVREIAATLAADERLPPEVVEGTVELTEKAADDLARAQALARGLASEVPKFVERSERFADLGPNAKRFLSGLPGRLRSLASALARVRLKKRDDDMPAGAIPKADELAKVLRRLRGRVEEAEIRRAIDAGLDDLANLLKVSSALERADVGGTVDIAKALPSTALILSPIQMATSVIEGEKTVIVKTRPFDIPKRVVLLSGRSALGVIEVSDRRQISQAELRKLESKTLITAKVQAEFGGDQKSWCDGPFWAWDVENVEAFPEPRETNAPAGPQALVRDIVVKAGLEREGGVHAHRLDREAKTTAADGAHSHIFRLPDGRLVETEADGQHEHRLESTDAEATTSGGEHGHVIRIDGRVRKTGAGVSAHEHELLVATTTFDGLHRHTLEIGEQTIESLLPGEFWALRAGEPADKQDLTTAELETDGGLRRPEQGVSFDPKRYQPAALRELDDRQLRLRDGELHGVFGALFEGNRKLSVDGIRREAVVNAHVFMVRELGRRKLDHADRKDELEDETRALLGKADLPQGDFAEIFAGGGEAFGRAVELDEFLGHLQKDMVIWKDAVVVVGSIANQGKAPRDIDVVVKGNPEEVVPHLMRFRVGRSFPPGISERVSLHGSAEFEGPFTSHVVTHDLVLRARPVRELVRMRGNPFADFLNREMRRRGMSVEELAERTGMRRAMIQEVVDGKIEAPHDKCLRAMARIFGTTVNHLRELAPGRVAKQDDPLLDLPPKSGPRPATAQYHFRGKSLHLDLRLRANDHLVGWTLSNQRSGAIKDPVDTIAEARAVARTYSAEGDRFTKPFLAPAKLFATPKARQPLVWLELDAVRFDPGEVGATRLESGVVLRVEPASLRVEFGIQKAFFHEYFFTRGRALNGIAFFRLLTGRRGEPEEEIEAGRRTRAGEPFWNMFLSKEFLPSVLKRRAVQTKTMPPDGRSAIPVSLERVTPREFQYWRAKGKEAREIRDALVEDGFFSAKNIRIVDGEFRRVVQKTFLYVPDDLEGERSPTGSRPPLYKTDEEVIDEGTFDICKQPRVVDFGLSWQFFKGQQVVRVTPSKQQWHLMLERPAGGLETWILQANPIEETDRVTAIRKLRRSRDLLTFEGAVEPGQRIGGDVLNETKATPSQIEILDKGKVGILDSQANFRKVRFRGGKLKGIYTLVAEEVGSDIWLFSRGSEPGRAIPTEKQVPVRDGVQIWDPKRKDPDADRAEFRPLALFKPQKVAPRPTNEFRSVDAALKWPTAEMLKAGIAVEGKWNGFRIVLEKDGRDRVLVFTEDTQRDLSPNLPSLTKELKSIPETFVLDGEFLALDADGQILPRRELGRFRGRGPVDDSGVRIKVFDVLYWDGKNLTAEEQTARRRALKSKVFDRKFKHLDFTDATVVHDRERMKAAIGRSSKLPGSEGAMLKLESSTYSLGGENDGWAKLKIVRAVRAIVHAREGVEGSPGVFNFLGGIGPIPKDEAEQWQETVEVGGRLYTPIGKTFNAKLAAKVGDVIEVEVTELRFEEDAEKKKRIAWFTPAVVDKVDEKPMTTQQVRRLLEEGEIEKIACGDIPILKTDEEQFVLGVVLEPNDGGQIKTDAGEETAPLDPDSQRDIYSAEEIRRTCHKFMERSGRIGFMHSEIINGDVIILENYIAPTSFEVNGQAVRAGTWLLALRIVNKDLWAAIKTGRFTGFSIGGSARRSRET